MSHESLTALFRTLRRNKPGEKFVPTQTHVDALDGALMSHSREEVKAALDESVSAADRVWLENRLTKQSLPLREWILQRKDHLDHPDPPVSAS